MFHVEVLTGTHRQYVGPAIHVILPGEEGEVSVMECHAPMLCALGPGLVQIDEQSFAIEGGLASVWRNHVMVVGP